MNAHRRGGPSPPHSIAQPNHVEAAAEDDLERLHLSDEPFVSPTNSVSISPITHETLLFHERAASKPRGGKGEGENSEPRRFSQPRAAKRGQEALKRSGSKKAWDVERRELRAAALQSDAAKHVTTPWSLIERSNPVRKAARKTAPTFEMTLDDDDDDEGADDENADSVYGTLSGCYSHPDGLRVSDLAASNSSLTTSAGLLSSRSGPSSSLVECELKALALVECMRALGAHVGPGAGLFALDEAQALASSLVTSIGRAREQDRGWQRNWNEEIVTALELPSAAARLAACETLWEDFHQTAQLFGSLIISERGLEPHCRTIKPHDDLGGVAGGEKMASDSVVCFFFFFLPLTILTTPPHR